MVRFMCDPPASSLLKCMQARKYVLLISWLIGTMRNCKVIITEIYKQNL